MGFLKPKVQTQAVRSQATPLAEDVLGLLRKEIMGGTFGSGLGPMQREAGTAISKFIQNRQDPGTFRELTNPLREASNIQTDKDAAAVRESFGAQGARISSSLARAEGDMRNEKALNLDAMINQMFLQEQDRLLQAIGAQQEFGNQNIMPFLSMAGMGINPDNVVVSDSPIMSILKLAAPVVGGVFGKPPV